MKKKQKQAKKPVNEAKQRHLEVGRIGENIAETFLVKRGYAVIQRNYRKKCGEIDIIAQKEGTLWFFEVKSVSCGTLPVIDLEGGSGGVTHETQSQGHIRPEENITRAKLLKLNRTIGLFLLEHNVPHETEWCLGAVVVYVDLQKRLARPYFLNLF